MRASTIIKRMRESELSREDLRKIDEAVRVKLDALDAQDIYTYAPGDYVRWQSRIAGHMVFGIVQKLNRKSVGVKAKDGRGWRVHLSFLERSSKEEYDKAPEFERTFAPGLPRPG